MNRSVLAIAAGVLAAIAGAPAPGNGQESAVVPLEAVTLSGAAARHALTTSEISIAAAEQIAKACVADAAAHNGGASIVILSPSGFLVHAYRTDGQLPNNIDSAYEKAKTALYMRTSTHEILNRWNSADAMVARANVHLYPVVGGLPIIVSDHLIGAIGVGGAPGDEQCAYDALTKVLGPQPPLASNK